MSTIREKLKYIFDLHEEKEQEHITITSIRRNVTFRGTRLWVLIFAIFIASIGLNVNSTAVIIGAMLISPLMGPIVGAGLALGINDFALLKKSLLHLFIATFISFLVSSLYFWISPIHEAQSEILSRTSPNIYDVLIAFFGGLAGIVGSSRKDKGVLLPGVAIATALMPPLCTAGYGFATQQPKYLLGAIYLYLINCTFIATATFLMVKYMRYRPVEHPSPQIARRVRLWTSFLVVLMVLPALFFAYKTVEELNFRKNVHHFIRDQFEKNGYTIIYQKINPKTLELAFLQKHFEPGEIDSLQNLLPRYGLNDYYLTIRQNMNEFSTDEWNKLLENLQTRDQRIQAIETKMNAPEPVPTDSSVKIGQEMKTYYPKVDKIVLAAPARSDSAVPVALIFRRKDTTRFTRTEISGMPLWLKARLKKDSITVVLQ